MSKLKLSNKHRLKGLHTFFLSSDLLLKRGINDSQRYTFNFWLIKDGRHFLISLQKQRLSMLNILFPCCLIFNEYIHCLEGTKYKYSHSNILKSRILDFFLNVTSSALRSDSTPNTKGTVVNQRFSSLDESSLEITLYEYSLF